MDLFMENPGLCHIGEKILANLDFKTHRKEIKRIYPITNPHFILRPSVSKN